MSNCMNLETCKQTASFVNVVQCTKVVWKDLQHPIHVSGSAHYPIKLKVNDICISTFMVQFEFPKKTVNVKVLLQLTLNVNNAAIHIRLCAWFPC